jgi:hypothetical protein
MALGNAYMKCGTIIILSPICPRDRNTKNRWGKLVEAYLTLVRHVSMRPTMTALRAGRAGVDVDPLYERMYTSWRKREG